METLSIIKTSASGGQLSGRLDDQSQLTVKKMPYKGMETTVEIIKRKIQTYRGFPWVRAKARKITRGIPENPRTGLPNMRNFDAIAQAIYEWIEDTIVYVRDPRDIERLQMPDATILLESGDCDDMVILAGALLQSLGVPTRIKLLGKKPGQFSHILLEYRADGQWKSFDPTLALYPGFEIPDVHIASTKIIPLRPPTPTGKAAGKPAAARASNGRSSRYSRSDYTFN